MKTKKLFISHSSKDITYARKFKNAFEEYGVDVWMDEGDLKIGDTLAETFEAAIEEADFFLLINSEHSIRSQWVRLELQFAIKTQTKILPVLIDSSNVFPEIREYKFLEISFENLDDFSFPFSELLQSIGLADDSAFRPMLTHVQFYDIDPTAHPNAKPKKVFKKGWMCPKYIYVSWEPKYFYQGVRFRRKWYRNDRLFGRVFHEDVWDNIWKEKKIHSTFIFNRFGHKRGKYHVRFYVNDEVISGSFTIE